MLHLPLAPSTVVSAWMRAGADRLDQRDQRNRRGARPVGERRHVEIDAFARIDGALPVERQMQAELGEQDVGKEFWAGAPARNRGARAQGLAARFAGALPPISVESHMPYYTPSTTAIERSLPAPNSAPTIVCLSCGDTMKHFRTISKVGVRREQLIFVCPSCKGVDTKEPVA
jgi:hypothetical protein